MQNILRKEIAEAIVNMCKQQKKEDRNTLRWSPSENKN